MSGSIGTGRNYKPITSRNLYDLEQMGTCSLRVSSLSGTVSQSHCNGYYVDLGGSRSFNYSHESVELGGSY